MYPVKVTVPAVSVNLPDVCTEEPINSKTVFCEKHYHVALEQKYPTDVREFLKFCGTQSRMCISTGIVNNYDLDFVIIYI